MGPRIAAAAVGAVFGVTLSWTGLSSPNVIRQGLLFENAYLFLFFGSAVAVAFVGLRISRRAAHARSSRASLVGWTVTSPQRRHVYGSLMFGVGWGLSDACPGPIATQLGQGILWSVFTIAGIVAGILLYLRREARAEESAPPAASALAASAGS